MVVSVPPVIRVSEPGALGLCFGRFYGKKLLVVLLLLVET